MNDMLTPALDLAERGYHLFPLVAGGKTPALTGNWQGAATRDPGTLERWFARSNCNIAVACQPSGIIAIDLDAAKPGADGPSHGIEALREVADGRDIPRTLTVATPSGGTHLYFRQPVDGTQLRNSARRLGPLIDTRGVGGYLVASGSRISGVSYRITDDVPLAEIPVWIAALLRPPDPLLEQPRRSPSELPAGIGSPYVRTALGRETARVATAKPGQRNHALNQAAYSLGRLIADGLLDRAQVEAQLTNAARRAGLERAETEATLNSGITAALRRHAEPVIIPERPASTSGTNLAGTASSIELQRIETSAKFTESAHPTEPPPSTLTALHAAFDALERELGEVAAARRSSSADSDHYRDYEPGVEGVAELLDQAVDAVRKLEPRAAALARTPEWHKLTAIVRAAADLVSQIRQAGREHAEDFRTDVYIHGAIRTIAARSCHQIAELASVAADRLARQGLADSSTCANLREVHRAAQQAEAKLTGSAPGQLKPERPRAARDQLKQIRRELRQVSPVQSSTQAAKVAMRTAERPVSQRRPRP